MQAIKFPKLFEPGYIGKLKLKNRIIFPPISTNFASVSGEVNEKIIKFYTERARGGAGLIIIENMCIDYPSARHGATQLRIDSDVFIPGLSELSQAIHDAGSFASVELTHPGLNADLRFSNNLKPVAPSAIEFRKDGIIPEELTLDKIDTLLQKYAQAALRAKRAGFDAVEIQGAHGLLVNQFLSFLTNKRSDKYGGSIRNRVRFAAEIRERIGKLVGEDFPVSIRLAVKEFTSGGIDLEEGKRIAKEIQRVGYNMIQADIGLGSREKRLEPMPYPQGWRVYLAEEIKKVVDIPVAAVGVIREPGFAEKILEEEKADFVVLGRTLIADPEWPLKAKRGEEKSIVRCIGCNECVRARHFEDRPIRCSVNPTIGRSWDFTALNKAWVRKKVMVIGAGPAGMEAARIAALRGHKVTLYDKENNLGGTLNIASTPPGKEKLRWLIEYFTYELPKVGVKIKLGEEINEKKVKDLNPQVVIVATGSKPQVPPIKGINSPNVEVAQDILSKKIRIENKNVVIIGGGLLGLETASFLSTLRNRITIIKRYRTISKNIEPIYRDYLVSELDRRNIKIIFEAKIAKIETNGVIIKDKGEERKIPADKIVIARSPKPQNELFYSLNNLKGYKVFLIGDAREPRKIINAIEEGFLVGNSI